MPVLLNEVSTAKEAYDYAMGSYKYAKCQATKVMYHEIADNISQEVQYGQAGVTWSTHISEIVTLTGGLIFPKAIVNINEKCKAEIGSVPKVPVQPKSPGSVTPPPPPNGGTTPAGFPLWLVLVLGGGALAYYLYTKKGGKKNPWGAGS